MKSCFIIVDCQYDFIEGGSLAVTGGKNACGAICRKLLDSSYAEIILTKDVHPENHCSFKVNGGQWPVHCVVGTDGAKIDEEIQQTVTILENRDGIKALFIEKGKNPVAEEYGAPVQADGIDRFDVGGIALDYCVLETAILTKKKYPDAEITIIKNCCTAVDKSIERYRYIIDECRKYGIVLQKK
jgi:nicotinamidase/pyrazinamidase